jgi:hypothetical protein
MTKLIVCVLLALVLAGCGGGGNKQVQGPTNLVDCIVQTDNGPVNGLCPEPVQ